jgi:hypothetical protein
MDSAENGFVDARETVRERVGGWAVRRRIAQAGPTLLLVVGALLLPNALAILASLWIGIPARSAPIAAYVVVILVGIRLPPLAVVPLYLTVVAFDLLMIVTEIFFLDIGSIHHNLDALTHVRLLSSPLYAGLTAALTAFVAAGLWFLVRYRAPMARGNRIVLALAVSGFLFADIAINSSASLSLGPAAAIGQPFQSAVQASGFAALTEPSPRKPNVLLVLVESLGVLRDPRQREVLFSAFDDAALREAFSITTGTTSFFGATSYGEMRELCHSRSAYTVLLDGHGPTCLPAQLAARGYRTVSVHGFTSAFYDRSSWYPKAGFVRSVFQDTATSAYTRHCGGAFVGPCDVDIAETIDDRLSKATQPLFVYWVTLNSHVPVRPGEATPRHDCKTGGPFGDPEVCAMAEIWEDLFAAVSRLAIRNPGTEILLVGDHAPPLWRRAARVRFEPDRVPWIRLAPHHPATPVLYRTASPQ